MGKKLETIKIATTFSTDRISEHSIISQCSYAYSIRRGLIMRYQQFTLQTTINASRL